MENGEGALRNLASRLLSGHYMEEGAEVPQLYVGELPEGMTFEIPMPEAVSLVGSLERQSRRRGQEIEVVLDSALDPGEAREAFGSALEEAGWEKRENAWREGGFEIGPFVIPDLFCKGERGPALHLTTNEVTLNEEGFLTDVRLRVSVEEGRNSPCFQRGRRAPFEEEIIIPALKPPPGAREIFGSGRGGYRDPEGEASSVALRTELGIGRLTEHYTAQLEEAGWTPAGGEETDGGDGNCSYRYYSFTNEEGEGWKAVFSALRLAGEERSYLLQVYAQLQE